MSAPAPAPVRPIPPLARLDFLPRLALAGALAGVGFVLVWRGFGLAGYGTDAHARRVVVAVAALLAAGFLAVQVRMWVAARAALLVLGTGTAGYAWWTVEDSDFKSRLSLRDAVAQRDALREQFARPLADDPRAGKRAKDALGALQQHFPSLTADLPPAFDRWTAGAEAAFDERVRQLPPDDTAAATAVWEPIQALAEIAPERAARLSPKIEAWVRASTAARLSELEALPPGDWEAFNRTAARRRAALELNGLVCREVGAGFTAETKWIAASAEARLRQRVAPGAPPRAVRAACLEVEKELRGLKTLNLVFGHGVYTAGGTAKLLEVAHAAAQAEVTAHIETGRYDLAFGVARAHAVEWSGSTIQIESKFGRALTALRDYCEALAKLSDASVNTIEVAPPPRAKPE